MAYLLALGGLAAACWLALLLLPWQPWRIRHVLEAAQPAAMHDIDVLVPARDEAAHIGPLLDSLARQGQGLRVIVVDDESRDDTAARARAAARETRAAVEVVVVDGAAKPPGWSGKVWAQRQGAEYLQRPMLLLLDADIVLAPGVVAALREQLDETTGPVPRGMVSLLAALSMRSGWERLLLPPFVFFFMTLYPFALTERHASRTAAAAGGCILLRREVLDAIGGFEALRNELIDDCALAARVKRAGYGVWTGLTRSVRSSRRYHSLASIWSMVTRTAYTQLRYSPLLLAVCGFAMLLTFVVPLAALAVGVIEFDRSGAAASVSVCGLLALLCMTLSYLPTLRFYGLPAWRAVTLPLAAALFLGMTLDSARRYYLGERSRWRGRRYAVTS